MTVKRVHVSVYATALVTWFAAALATAGERQIRDNPANDPSAASWAHREAPDDPPQLRHRTRTQGALRPAQTWARGVFVSVQVNVNGSGQNIVGDAANEPSIAVDPTNPNRMAIGWRQFDTISSNFRQGGWAFTQDGGDTWAFPGVINDVEFASDPVLGSNGNGEFYYLSLQPDRGPGDWACYLYKSANGGVTWPQDVYSFGGDKAWMGIDRSGGIGDGNVYIAWSPFAGCCPGELFTRSTDGGLSFLTPIAIPANPRWGTIAVGPGGEMYVVGATSSGIGDFVVVRSDNAQNPAVTPTFNAAVGVNLGGVIGSSAGPNPGGLLGQVWIECDRSGGASDGDVYVLASVDPFGGDPSDVMFSRSTDGGLTWSPPVRVNDDSQGNGAWQWFGTMSVAPDGRIDVFWNDTRNNTQSANLSELYYSFSDDGGVSWAPNQAVSPVFNSHIGWPNQNKIGDYYHCVSDNQGVSLAYSATFNGEQDVYFLRINRLAECTVNADCNDFLFCNGEETCVIGQCVDGTPPCQPPLVCSESLNACVPCNNNASCQDGSFCNGAETCVAGECLLGEDPCPDTFCDDGVGACVECLLGEHCDDSDMCTDDSCVAGACEYFSVLCLPPKTCDPADGRCKECRSDADCDDGRPCLLPEGVCGGCFTDAECDDGNPCTDDACLSAVCQNTNNDDPCDDAIYCNGEDTCGGGSCSQHSGTPCNAGEVCVEDEQVCGCGSDAFCDDGNPCTDDACVAARCEYANNSAACDDGVFCNGTDSCAAGVCAHSGSPCDVGEVCLEDEQTCGCGSDADCDDGLYCNGADTCIAGVCEHGGSPCDVDYACIEATQECCPADCVEGDVCVCPPCTINADCADGDPCTFNRCLDLACRSTDALYGDVAGFEGSCGPDGQVDLLDILAVLNGFAGDFADGCELSNIDLTSKPEACLPDGTIDLFDILAELNAFSGTDVCCPVQRK